jgi:hypothetical protein
MTWPSSYVALQETATKIVVDPRLPLRVKFIGATTPAVEIMGAFEAGEILVWDGFPMPVDLKFLRGMPVWPDTNRRIKKAKARELLAPLPHNPGKDFSGHLLGEIYGKDHKTASAFQAQARGMFDHMRAQFACMFPKYRPTGDESHSLRLVQSFPEGMHVDYYENLDDEAVRVRMFYNYDDTPRVWSTTQTAPELLERYWGDLARYADMHPNVINFHIDQTIPWHEPPRHTIFFAPGTLWMADTQLVSHEIFYGRRAAAFTFGVEPYSLVDPALRFQMRMRSAAARLKEATNGQAG